MTKAETWNHLSLGHSHFIRHSGFVIRHSPTILLTGYWPPTNEMLRRFSRNPAQNPGGWIGENWEGRGYDIVAHFPEFPPGTGPGTEQPWGVGELEVDYRKTYADFTRLLETYRPRALITFSRGKKGSNWEIEPACRRWRLPGETGYDHVGPYLTDRREPGYPFDLPPCQDPPGTMYHSTLPTAQIAAAVNEATAGRVEAFVPALDEAYTFGGAYLSGFIGLLGTSYQHHTPDCLAAGHIHVGIDTPVEEAEMAVDVTLRVLIKQIHYGGTKTQRRVT